MQKTNISMKMREYESFWKKSDWFYVQFLCVHVCVVPIILAQDQLDRLPIHYSEIQLKQLIFIRSGIMYMHLSIVFAKTKGGKFENWSFGCFSSAVNGYGLNSMVKGNTDICNAGRQITYNFDIYIWNNLLGFGIANFLLLQYSTI